MRAANPGRATLCVVALAMIPALGQNNESAGAVPAATTRAYRIQAGDDLQIRAFNLPELEQMVVVRPDGRVSLLLLNDVEAEGRSPDELSQALSKAYAEHFRNPRVTVIVKTFRNRSVYIGGEVNQPKLITMNGRLTTAAAIFLAGGFKDTAKTAEVILIRDSGKDGQPLLARLNMEDVLKKGAPDIPLQPFDVVYVPKSKIAELNKFIDQYIRQMNPIQVNAGFTYILGGQNLQVAIP